MAKIVVVEDSPFAREIHRMFLTNDGHSVIEAEDGEEGVQQFIDNNPDLTIIDVNLPTKNGIETLIDIKKHSPTVKIIICTAIDDQRIIRLAFQNGASGYITKPFKRELYLNEIQKHLENSVYVQSLDDKN